MIKKSDVLARKLGLSFNDPGLLKVALTHRSAGAGNNERLEYLGDSVLGFVIAEALFQRFPAAGEGVLSRLRASLVNQNSLAELARDCHIGDYLILGAGELKSGGFRRESILSDALEAIMGALLLDQGVQACRDWILTLFDGKLQALRIDNWDKDPKTRLQELMQAQRQPLPIYELLATSGDEHAQLFDVECRVDACPQTTRGSGVSRKKAEQMAAEAMLNLLQTLNQ
ncbi:MAG: ribonuclease III [Methylomonas sp.]|nr:ribonuclease III [Methylomonas sp.]PPD21040.1 MAG: ribonuclease III [Methylomonas sp.]PPD27067.1 MAG: ribonuclease III [Methylomonas sp.]PPD39000.1 MAG: ribonuclease III [Methylomonas sp.]PPD40880.1 MAG: ribonuclease III [Methylomonas sp.]